MKAKELSKLDSKALVEKLHELKTKYSVEYVKSKVGSKTEKAVSLKNIKKDIARVNTLLNLKNKEIIAPKAIAKEPKKIVEKKSVKTVDKKNKGEK